MRALGLTLILLPSVVLAQPAVAPAPLPPAEDQGECTVTTTVRCTGAAAPYAVQAAQPAPAEPPIVIQAPPAPPPPVAPSPPIVPSQALILDARHLVGEGWRLTQSPDGRLWRERKVSTESPAMWGGGMALWLTTYFAGAIAGQMQGDFNQVAWLPIVGPMLLAGFSSGSGTQALWAVDSLAQGTGFVLFLVGLAAGPEKIERLPVSVGPIGLVGGGSGVALTGRF
jgi:hypothetical protein